MKKIILVTGAGSGLGREISRLLAPESTVIGLGLGSKNLNLLKKEIGCDIYSCDISKSSQVSSVSKKILKKYGKIDCLINNAGIWTEGSLTEEDDKKMEKVLEVNVLGSMLVSKYFLPLLLKTKNGLIINIVSQAGLSAKPNRSVYGASKWALTGFTKYLSSEVLPAGIRVTGIYPDKMETSLFRGLKVKKDMSDALNPTLVAQSVKFVIDQPDEVYVPELGIKSVKKLQ